MSQFQIYPIDYIGLLVTTAVYSFDIYVVLLKTPICMIFFFKHAYIFGTHKVLIHVRGYKLIREYAAVKVSTCMSTLYKLKLHNLN